MESVEPWIVILSGRVKRERVSKSLRLGGLAVAIIIQS